MFKIINRAGGVDIKLRDGKYRVKADITIKNGQIKFIDDGVWTPYKPSYGYKDK